MPFKTVHIAGLSATIVACVAHVSSAQANQDRPVRYVLPAQSLHQSLDDIARRSGMNVVASAELVDNLTAPAVDGEYTLQELVELLLTPNGLAARVADRALIIERLASTERQSKSAGNTDIIVTGSRIRGAAVASPVITVTREDIRNAGQAMMGDVVRSIPQSFGGGQNPGIGLNVPATSATNVGGGSSVNLRGLGSDATLTLLNGKRLGYSGSRQSVDISTIPVGAVDRIEVVADGASALYGSDAVGGVVNILLQRDYEGVEMRASVGASTEGGNVRQQYSATGGNTWAQGGFIAAYEFNRNSPIVASERDYARDRSPGLTLYPGSRDHNALVSGHQQIGERVRLRFDGLFNHRTHGFTYANNPAGSLLVGRTTQSTASRAFSIAPTIEYLSDFGWAFALNGSYAQEDLDYRVVNFVGASGSVLTAGCFCNRSQWIEGSGDGGLFLLPAGEAKLALGIGYRNADLINDRGPSDPLGFSRSQSSRYGYGELEIPLISPSMSVSGLHRFSVSAAARYEAYDGAGSVTTPKIGLILAPTPDLDFRATWGRSYRAPTLFQRYQPPSIVLLNASSFGAVGAPVGATGALVQGGQPDLDPEKASTWSITATTRPQFAPGFRIEASYFEIDYRDRIVAPIGFTSRALSDPAFAAFVTRLPSVDTVDDLLSRGDYFVNGTGRPFDPANVVAIIDNRSVNAGRQRARGIDLLFSYRTESNEGADALALTGNVSHLRSERQISSDQPNLQLAGILYNPPRWRGRLSATWTSGDFTLSGTAHYTGKLKDTRFSPTEILPAQARIDVVARYQVQNPIWSEFRGLEIALGVENFLNAGPPPISTSAVTDTPYDSTNYAPFGRVVSLSLAKKW